MTLYILGSEARDESYVGEWRLESPHPREYSRGSPQARGDKEKRNFVSSLISMLSCTVTDSGLSSGWTLGRPECRGRLMPDRCNLNLIQLPRHVSR